MTKQDVTFTPSTRSADNRIVKIDGEQVGCILKFHHHGTYKVTLTGARAQFLPARSFSSLESAQNFVIWFVAETSHIS